MIKEKTFKMKIYNMQSDNWVQLSNGLLSTSIYYNGIAIEHFYWVRLR